MKIFKDLFKSQAVLEAERKAQEDALRAKIQQETEAKALEEQRKREEIAQEILREKLESTTPWFEAIIGAEDKIHAHERYRWNNACIKDLIKKGFKGDTDNQIFQAYLDKQEEDAKKLILEEEREKKRNSSEPWVEVISESLADDRIVLSLDWNDAFIVYLRKNGFRGATEEMLVQNWLASLERELNPEEFV